MTWVGHVHLYARTCPVLQKTCLGWNADGTAAAPIHMSMGHGGFEFTWFMNPTPPDYFDAVYIEHGYMRVEANATNLHITGVSSDTGHVMDDFVLTKPKGWQPQGFKAKKAYLDLFVSNYTAVNPFEYPGVSSNTLWTEPLYVPVATIMEHNETLLKEILAHKPDFMVNINAGDTVKNLASIFKYYYQEFHSAAYHSAIPAGQESVANAYLNGIIYPLLEFFFNNTAFAQKHPNFDAGTVVAPKNQGGPGVKTEPIYP